MGNVHLNEDALIGQLTVYHPHSQSYTETCLALLYPYSKQAKNCPNRHKLIFFLFGGIREVSLNYVLQVSPDSDTMSLRIFGGIGLNSAGIYD